MASLFDLARHLEGMNQGMGAVLQVVVEEGAEILREHADMNLGTHRFAALAASTVERKGFDDQLVSMGGLKASLRTEIGHHMALIGSDDPKAAWMEFGTSRIPARPFLGTAIIDAIGQLRAMALRVMKGASGHEGHGSALEEALHAAHQIYEEGRHVAEDALDR